MPRTLPPLLRAACGSPAQVPHSRPPVLDGGPLELGPVAPVAPAPAQEAINLTQIVLDAEFAEGMHLAYTNGAFRFFDRTHWTTLSEAELGHIILKHIRRGSVLRQRSPLVIRDVIATLRHASATTTLNRVADARPIINVANGELWFGKDGTELRPHDPASNQHQCSDLIYEPNATCPNYDRAIADIFSSSLNQPALTKFWHEFVGYVLQPIRRQPLIVVAAGRGRDGKSALAETLVRLLGRAQVTAMPVEDLTGSRFILGDLAASRVFLDADMTAGVLLPDGMLKKLSEGTTVTAERKYRDPITFTMRAVPLLLTNTTPELADHSLGFRRRLLVLPFERQFAEAEVDYGLFPNIHETELSGVLNRALEGLQRVIQRGWKFDPPDAVLRATDKWWATATGSVPVSGSTIRRTKKAVRGPDPMSLSAATPLETYISNERIVVEQGAIPSDQVKLSVALPHIGKGCSVKVIAGGTTVEVRVEGEPVRT